MKQNSNNGGTIIQVPIDLYTTVRKIFNDVLLRMDYEDVLVLVTIIVGLSAVAIAKFIRIRPTSYHCETQTRCTCRRRRARRTCRKKSRASCRIDEERLMRCLQYLYMNAQDDMQLHLYRICKQKSVFAIYIQCLYRKMLNTTSDILSYFKMVIYVSRFNKFAQEV